MAPRGPERPKGAQASKIAKRFCVDCAHGAMAWVRSHALSRIHWTLEPSRRTANTVGLLQSLSRARAPLHTRPTLRLDVMGDRFWTDRPGNARSASSARGKSRIPGSPRANKKPARWAGLLFAGGELGIRRKNRFAIFAGFARKARARPFRRHWRLKPSRVRIPSSAPAHEKSPAMPGSCVCWRRAGDSNPRTGHTRYSLSRRAPSATRSALRGARAF